jgi:hypothetical protein
VPAEGRSVYGQGRAMNESPERRGAGNRHSGTTLFGELWKYRARSVSRHVDHAVLAELVARRWKEDRSYLMSKIQG